MLDEGVAKDAKKRDNVIRIERGNMVTVVLRDWGRTVRCHISEIYMLKGRFREERSHPKWICQYIAVEAQHQLISSSQRLYKIASRASGGLDAD